LGTLADNGGPTQTIAPNVDSPLIDKIPPGVNGCGTSVTTDQRGVPRPQGAGCDIGAVEVTGNAVPSPCGGIVAGTGAFLGNLEIDSPATCAVIGATINGFIHMRPGKLFLFFATVNGNIEVTGGSVSIGTSTVINGNLEIHDVDSTSKGSVVCGANISGDFEFHNNAATIAIGGNPLSVCAGNTIGGNLQIHNNAALVQTLDNTVQGSLDIHNNTAPIQVVGNTVSGKLSCEGNTSITGGPNPGSNHAEGQCFQTRALAPQ
jgi:hypothetical protein